ncbi:MAG: outer membrane protein transport protein [Planctomycetaceae bacterium]
MLTTSSALAQMGHVLDGVGAVNQSMGGAGTGMPLDAIGALQWNPASIAGLPRSEFGFAFTGFQPQTRISSRVDANAFGPGSPPATLNGDTRSDAGMSPIPSMAVVCRNQRSPWTYGLGGFGIGGFGVNYRGDLSNPILTPQPANGGMGFGSVYSQFQLMQICPTVAYTFNNGWSVGAAPTFNWATLAIDPFPAATPNGNGAYPSAAHGDSTWGMGFQVGVYYQTRENPWSFGASYKSTQWFSDFEMNAVDQFGGHRLVTLGLDYPSMTSLGVGYRGFEKLTLATDVRYIDYANTDGFNEQGFDATGAVKGFGWDSVFAVSTGLQYELRPSLFWRIGYTFNTCPIDSSTAFYNTPAPALVQHHLSTSISAVIARDWVWTFAYHHGFENSVTGNWQHPAFGSVPGTSVTHSLSTDSFLFSISHRF